MPKNTAHLANDSVQGLVERVTYHNEENGFAVIKVKSRGKKDLVTVIGNIASISPGEWLVAEGSWIRDRDHGLQLKCVRIQTSAPSSLEGIEKYLGSGMVKGIGPIYAKKMVEKFGEKIFDIIDSQSAKLEDIDGIGPGRRKKIKEAWAEQQIIREIMVFLHSNGISTSRALRIYKTYGDKAIERLQDNPYILVRDIHGIGFLTADKMAQSMGIPHDSVLRAKAGVMHILATAASEGHCGLPIIDILESTEKLLDVSSDRVLEGFDNCLSNGDILRVPFGEGLKHLIMLPIYNTAEEQIFHSIKNLSQSPKTLPDVKIDAAFEWCKTKTDLDLEEQQKEAIKQALTSRVSVITGGPGVGKTTLVKSLLLILRAKKVKTMLCAPTGRAAKRLEESSGLEAKTIHRLLEGRIGGFNRNTHNPIECDALIVDESSMIDVLLMASLLRALPSKAHLILVGDIDQLPSVGPGTVLMDIIQSNVVPVVRLTKIFRQANASKITTVAHQINSGHLEGIDDSQPEDDFFFIEREDSDKTSDSLINFVAKKLPSSFHIDPIKQIQVLCPMNKGNLGVYEMNHKLQEKLNPIKEGIPRVEKFGYKFQAGDKVIQTQNNYDKDVFNGDIGIIASIDLDSRTVVIDYEGQRIEYDFNELDEISLAYAITIHKSQGSEFPVVVLPVAMQQFIMLQRNLLYTGITRGKNKVIVVGQKKAFQYAVKNKESALRYSSLKSRLSRLSEI